MTTGSRKPRRLALLAAMAVLAMGAVSANDAANAAPVQSQVTASPNPVNLTVGGSSVTVTTQLDSNCPNAIDGGLSYNILATATHSATATVSRIGSGTVADCSTPITFTATPVGCGTTSVTFTPYVYNNSGKAPKGAQNKVLAVVVPINVTGIDCLPAGVDPGGEGRPAAPAVANAYVNTSAGSTWIAQSCSLVYKKAGKLWRGALIKDVAAYMPLPESIKNDVLYFPTAGDWRGYVIEGVQALCSGSPGATAFPTPVPVA